jgi:hypothetical protein
MNALWKLPGEPMKRWRGAWQVRSEPGLGPARALLAPLVRAGAARWQLALPANAPVAMTSVDDASWTTVPLLAAPGATHHLPVLRYDHPADRPGTAFRLLLDQDALQARLAHLAGPPPPILSGAASPGSVTAAELERVLADQLAHHGERLHLYTVAAAAAAPAPNPAELRFAFASCQYPAGMLDRQVAHASYRALATYLADASRPLPERLLLLGDQVYTDATYGLLDPTRLDDRYRMPYEGLKDRETGPMAELPQEMLARVRMTPDDHEILDNWEPQTPGPLVDPAFEHAVDAFWQHQRQGDARRRRVHLMDRGAGWRLFMLDTRTQRSFRSEDTVGHASLLGPRQSRQLLRWLRACPPQDLKIVTSPAMLLPRARRALDGPLHQDGWQGYPASLHGLLAFLCDRQVQNLVFLSGDAHVACTAHIRVRNMATGASCSFHSHHAPALYAPYPFGNDHRWNLLLADCFRFAAPAQPGSAYECTVEADMVEEGRQGCGLLTATLTRAGWTTSMQVIR